MLEAKWAHTMSQENGFPRGRESLDESKVHPVASSLSGRNYQAPSYAFAVIETVAKPFELPRSETFTIVP
jgi:hypothetical protein